MGSVHIITRQPELLANRQQAAEMLNTHLADYQGTDNMVVLGIPRGGVILADIVARHFNAHLDVMLTRKVRAPHNPELAIGAVSEDGTLYKNQSIITSLGVTEAYIEQEKQQQAETIAYRKIQYRAMLDKVPLRDKVVILTDDGVATGATMQAAVWAAAAESPQKLILALPVAPPDTVKRLAQDADETICLCAPANFQAISQFYTVFEQVNDRQVLDVLKNSAHIDTRRS